MKDIAIVSKGIRKKGIVAGEKAGNFGLGGVRRGVVVSLFFCALGQGCECGDWEIMDTIGQRIQSFAEWFAKFFVV